MRTTINLDDDLLEIVKGRARHEGVSLGAFVSDALRQVLLPAPPQEAVEGERVRNGFPLLPRRRGSQAATNRLVNQIREEEGI